MIEKLGLIKILTEEEFVSSLSGDLNKLVIVN
jgi:hypothetical protein